MEHQKVTVFANALNEQAARMAEKIGCRIVGTTSVVSVTEEDRDKAEVQLTVTLQKDPMLPQGK